MQRHLAVIGASGGLGAALAAHAEKQDWRVTRLSRPAIDADDEPAIARAAEAAGDALDRVIVASGLLHRGAQRPERSWQDIDPQWMLANYRVNAVLPALAAKHFLPRLRRDAPSLLAVLTAKVGSIGDNRLGGWHSYRASKAAANQLVKTMSVELKRRNPQAAIVALHPGTADTALSKPFQRNLADGQLVRPDVAASRLWNVMAAIGPADSGRFLGWDGDTIPW